ncbi:hypothetical protein B0H66DRAFT_543291 [Apodospora peruviana]|uniref:proline--tRNA ligase n=1 Tax=Apodospora peruviana TaxID=516989 RepID=A0AAE0MFY3_9PEZI|nr:hypothetical protein B0H66DRAFT_543291 [Apodospora peruviana]
MLRQHSASRLSRIWVTTGGIAGSGIEDGHSKLIRAGFLRQAYPGVFHMLPLGRRVQEKTERLVEKHMEEGLAASRVSLSSISAQSLWDKSGRLKSVASELFKFSDRRDVSYLLSPTHEEEITSLVARTVKSHKELPLRLYQITRKYRDEFRPRHGLLRGREFIMKDLYTFDSTVSSALETYEQVRHAYTNIFREMRLPVLAARASSGDMGGDLSHEYLLPTALGEDRVASCDSCDYVVNEEMVDTPAATVPFPETTPIGVWRGITKDRSTLVNVWYPKTTKLSADEDSQDYTDMDVNISTIKTVVPDLDAGVEDAVSLWVAAVSETTNGPTSLVNIIDGRLPSSLKEDLASERPKAPVWPEGLVALQPALVASVHSADSRAEKPLNVLRIRNGDRCPRCVSGLLKVERAIELGHTFHLGTRYSEPLEANVSLPTTSSSIASVDAAHVRGSESGKGVPIQMGCHGIGISRIIGAVAEHLADEKGLNWPVAIAPYSCVVIPGRDAGDEDALRIYQDIIAASGPKTEHLDVVIDDRQKSLPWKLTDADLVGFPLVVVLGREWLASKRVEIQCRRLGIKDVIGVNELPDVIKTIYSLL